MGHVLGTVAGLFLAVLFVAVAVGLYMLPTIVAVIRHARNIGPIVVINVLLGWSIFGWVAALASAAGGNRNWTSATRSCRTARASRLG